MKLGFGLTFEDFYRQEGLENLDARFLQRLEAEDGALREALLAARIRPGALSDKDYSALLIALAPKLEAMLGELFGIEGELEDLRRRHEALKPVSACKRLFVQRRAARAFKPEEAEAMNGNALEKELSTLFGGAFDEVIFASRVMEWLADEQAHQAEIDLALRYAAWALLSEDGRKRHRHGVLFKQPKKLDFQHLVELHTREADGIAILETPASHRRIRRGFSLTDPRGSLKKAEDEAHYCIYCHNQEKDSCSRGFKEKDGSFRQSPLNVALTGCPLEEKISEMNFLKAEGVPVGALAAVVVDNPMCAGTGHRICNDCMKSCIYQKQEPVNIPLVETRVLDDVLSLPYGFEIYALLTRWNPLNLSRFLPKPPTGKKVLVAGLGPAGYTLSHHLLNDGHAVLAVDGLKIEPLPPECLQPVKSVEDLRQNLARRAPGGFGGVAEYGITVRWDKNFLTLIRMLLERREQFALAGGVRFGSTITYDDAFALGFDHIALCLGAGKPTLLDIPNGVARGVRAASDFLMALQLTGAAREESIANLQLRLPVVVIGGGLTAIDTATEALAYYPVQVEKFLKRYEALGGPDVGWSEEEKIIAEEFLSHARQLRAASPEEIPALLNRWGGVKVLYRKRLIDAPSYRLNHEEVEKAFEEGIGFAENWEPEAVKLDRFGHAEGLKIRRTGGEEHLTLPARAILVAAGTSPNTVLAREDSAHFTLDGKYFQAVDESGSPASPERSPKPQAPQVLLHRAADGKSASFFGDLHPSYAGNVVRAMASAKQGYPVISRVLAERSCKLQVASCEFLGEMKEQLSATVHEVNRLNRNIVEVVIRSPLAAGRFEPGQFYRLQNLEANATRNSQLATTLSMEGLAMTGAWVDKENGLVAVIVLEMGGSSDLCALLKPGEEVTLMGPTGTPTIIPEKETVLLAGGGLGNAVLFSIGRAFREKGGKALYFAAYRKLEDRFKEEEIEAAADSVVWCCEEGMLPARRAGDLSFQGSIIDAMAAYAEGKLGVQPILLSEVRRVIAIGSDGMMAAVKAARHGALKPYLPVNHAAIGSINSPMQCMMKEICAQCLQEHRDPETGKISSVYSCFDQDQCLDKVDFPHLRQRLLQNAVQEKLTRQWIRACLPNI